MQSTESGAWRTVGAWQMVAITLIVVTVIIGTPMSPRTERYKPLAFEFRPSPTPPLSPPPPHYYDHLPLMYLGQR